MNTESHNTPDALFNHFAGAGLFTELDLHFARLMTGLDQRSAEAIFLAAALASRYTRSGHVCLDLAAVAGKPWPSSADAEQRIVCPELSAWVALLETSPVVGKPPGAFPLILTDGPRLYLHRYWEYEHVLGEALNDLAGQHADDVDPVGLERQLRRLFPDRDTDALIDWQKIAACLAVIRRLVVISGGPGTGKTTTVAKIIVLLTTVTRNTDMRIALAAPTGKAAHRLGGAIGRSIGELVGDDVVQAQPPKAAVTIHRLLGAIQGSPYFKYNAERRLPYEAVIVDEASMVDVALLSKLVQALRPDARLILLGDKDQLASVEAGAVLGDLCRLPITNRFGDPVAESVAKACGLDPKNLTLTGAISPMQNSVIQLKESFRFGTDSGIGLISAALRIGDTETALRTAAESELDDVQWIDRPMGPQRLSGRLGRVIVDGYRPYLTAASPGQALDRFERFRILSAVRQGTFGVDQMNAQAEQLLRGAGLITMTGAWYRGRPVVVTRNDYRLRLFNGDTGIVLSDPEDGHRLKVFFSGEGGEIRRFQIEQVHNCETAFAMTVHKSQGSEFDSLIFVLPEKDVSLLSRELLYTALTRARRGVMIWGDRAVFRSAADRRIERSSRLGEILGLSDGAGNA